MKHLDTFGLERTGNSVQPARFRFLTYLMAGLIMNGISSTAFAGPFVEVTREVLLESGDFPIPRVLIQTKERGYVVAGSFSGYIPWATRIAPDGSLQWRYEASENDRSFQGGGGARYEGAVAMGDDSALLCGFRDVGKNKDKPEIVGMLTRIDRSGRSVRHQLLYPRGDKSFHLSYLHKCVPWGDGFVAVGETTKWITGGRGAQHFLWLVVLNESGEVESEYLVENVSPGIPLAMPNNHLVIVGPSEITLLDRHGVVKAQKVLTGRDRVTAVQSLTPDSQVRLFPIFSGPASALHTLGEHLEERGLSRGAGAMLVTNRAYVQPGGSLMLFGYQALSEPGGPKADTAAITRLSADLAKRESFFFQPLWTSNSIVDAVPTGQPGEFVTVRHVRAVKRWPNEKRTGLVIAFVRTQQTN